MQGEGGGCRGKVEWGAGGWWSGVQEEGGVGFRGKVEWGAGGRWSEVHGEGEVGCRGKVVWRGAGGKSRGAWFVVAAIPHRKRGE